jgi:hypothetical protein
MGLMDRWKGTPGRGKNARTQRAAPSLEAPSLSGRSDASRDFSACLAQLPSTSLNEYANECLTQTLVNAGL